MADDDEMLAEHEGYGVRVKAFKSGSGYLWTYQIDGEPPVECRDRPLRDVDAAHIDGFAQARLEIAKRVKAARGG